MKISFNSPVVLGFALIACGVLLLDEVLLHNLIERYFVCPGHFNWSDPLDYFRMFSHVIGHGSWQHLVSNFALILLIGPILEEKYGGRNLLLMMLLTALVTGILNVMLWDTGLLGASGIVFMMILLGSLVNFRSGTIPLTFVLVVVLYLGQEIYNALDVKDQVSQFAHILGGLCGMLFGFALSGKKVPVKITS